MEKGNKPNRLLWILGGSAVAAFLIVLGLYIAYFKNLSIANDSATWGTFGDYLGGTLNPIISFLALIGLLYTIHQQAQEMQATREELKQAAEQQRQQVEQQSRQSEIFNLQQFESSFFSLLEQHNEAVEKIEVEATNEEIYYAYNDKLGGIAGCKPSEELSNSHAIKSINQHYELKSYFNLLFQILKFISISLSHNSKNSELNNSEDSKITIKDFDSDNKISKKKLSQEYITPRERMYSDILRSFIPNHILKLLALNCLTIDEFSQDYELETLYNFQSLLNRYALLEQLQLSCTNLKKIDISSLINEDNAIHFLILTSHIDIASAFGNSNILAKSKEFFNYRFNYWLTVNTKSLHNKQYELKNIKRKIIRLEPMLCEEYEMLDISERDELLLIYEGQYYFHQPDNNFNAWKQEYLEKLENEKKYYEEKINEINTELKRIEENKKAWLEFLQIEDNRAIYSML